MKKSPVDRTGEQGQADTLPRTISASTVYQCISIRSSSYLAAPPNLQDGFVLPAWPDFSLASTRQLLDDQLRCSNFDVDEVGIRVGTFNAGFEIPTPRNFASVFLYAIWGAHFREALASPNVYLPRLPSTDQARRSSVHHTIAFYSLLRHCKSSLLHIFCVFNISPNEKTSQIGLLHVEKHPREI